MWDVGDVVIYWEQFLPIEPYFYFTFQLTNCFYCNYLAKSKNKGFLERGVKRQFLTYSTTWRSSKDQDKDLHRYKSVPLLTQFSWLLKSSWVQESQKKVQKIGILALPWLSDDFLFRNSWGPKTFSLAARRIRAKLTIDPKRAFKFPKDIYQKNVILIPFYVLETRIQFFECARTPAWEYFLILLICTQEQYSIIKNDSVWKSCKKGLQNFYRTTIKLIYNNEVWRASLSHWHCLSQKT